MPLTRFLLNSNNYGMAMHELYNEETVVINNNEDNNNNTDIVDSKALLDSLSVSSLVSILRHLADLSQFAAEVFHGLQEQVAATTSRSRKLASRVQQAESSLPQIEKAFLSQTSHMHYVYTPGSEWHARIRNEKNHFICDDLPHFIMDSYEESREPPRLHILDRFDTGGPGSCLKRYSDPTFFKRASASKVPNGKKSLDERDSRRIKRRRSWQQSGCFPDFAPTLDGSGRLQLSSSTFQEQFSVSQTGSTSDPTFKSDLRDKSDSPASKNGTGDFIECVFHPSTLIQPDNTETNGICSDLNKERVNEHVSLYLDEHTASMKATLLKSSSMRWDRKVDFASNEEDNGMNVVCQVGNFSEGEHDVEVDWNQHDDDDESETDHFVDALNTIESESESDFERRTNKEKVLISSPNDELLESPLNEQMKINHCEPKHACHSLSRHNEESSHHDDLRRSKPTIFSILNTDHSDPDASTNVSENEHCDIQQEPNITSLWSNDSENKSNDAVSHYSQSSPPLSPQLEHMKISHRHIDISKASILTLKYPKEVDNHDISVDTFSSFQLVPESVTLKHDIGSGSDDNNDYLIRNLSDSNSEELGTEDDSEIDYNGLNNGLNSISLTESTSSSPRCGQTALRRINVGATFVNEVHSESDCSSERPIVVGNDSIADQEMTYSEQPTPETPPLPPLQWRVLKSQLNAEGRVQDHSSNNVIQSPDDNRSHLAAMDSARLLNSSDESVTALKANEERDEPRVNFRNKFHQAVDEKREDEKGDFLHQIRTKSYNLRRTVTVRPTYTTSSATSNKVAAILQKANAIRRAVGSDGEDDSWSDT